MSARTDGSSWALFISPLLNEYLARQRVEQRAAVAHDLSRDCSAALVLLGAPAGSVCATCELPAWLTVGAA